jgi:hypothetical protein
MGRWWGGFAAGLIASAAMLSFPLILPARADTLESALVSAHQNNPMLNS